MRRKEIFSAASIISADVLACDFLSNQADLIPREVLNVFVREAVVVEKFPYFVENDNIRIRGIRV